jgi:hypothetical protein
MAETVAALAVAVAPRRIRHAKPGSGSGDAERREAAAALQRALDRRDNGGITGH